MEHYQWRIHRLLELSPFEGTLLGYNRNQGETIAVKIRTYDLEGFSPYDLVKDVVLHELTHMHHKEHNAEFHALHRQLHRHCEEVERRLAQGRSTSGARMLPSRGPIFAQTISASSSTADHGGGERRLGGGVGTTTIKPTSLLGDPGKRRALLANKALERMKKGDKDKP